MGGRRNSSTEAAVEVIGGHPVVQRLARGGMAELLLVRNTGLEGFEKIVVLKRILPQLAGDPEFVRMFLDEARLAATLDHPNVVRVYDIGRDEDEYFFTMEYIHGEDLRALLHEANMREQAIPLPHVLHIAIGTAAGLHHAHERIGFDGNPLGIVHRDVSLTNVLVTYDGGVKLVDFGIAKAASSQHATRPSTRKGKTSYMSPEQCRGRTLDRRSDVFSLGIVLWELSVGQRLFAADDEFAIMNSIVNYDARSPREVVPDYPEALEAIVTRALARDPDERYPTARALQLDLERFAHDEHVPLSSAALGEYLTELMGPKPIPWASNVPGTAPGAGPVDDDATHPHPVEAATATVSVDPGRLPKTDPAPTEEPSTQTVVPSAPPPRPRGRGTWLVAVGLGAALGGAGLTAVNAWIGSGSDGAAPPRDSPPRPSAPAEAPASVAAPASAISPDAPAQTALPASETAASAQPGADSVAPAEDAEPAGKPNEVAATPAADDTPTTTAPRKRKRRRTSGTKRDSTKPQADAKLGRDDFVPM